VVRTPTLQPEASPRELWDEIGAHRTEESLLLSSYEPLKSAAVAFLLGSPALLVEMKKAALVRIEVRQRTISRTADLALEIVSRTGKHQKAPRILDFS